LLPSLRPPTFHRFKQIEQAASRARGEVGVAVKHIESGTASFTPTRST
jgi:hypothetical protein